MGQRSQVTLRAVVSDENHAKAMTKKSCEEVKRKYSLRANGCKHSGNCLKDIEVTENGSEYEFVKLSQNASAYSAYYD